MPKRNKRKVKAIEKAYMNWKYNVLGAAEAETHLKAYLLGQIDLTEKQVFEYLRQMDPKLNNIDLLRMTSSFCKCRKEVDIIKTNNNTVEDIPYA